MAHLTAHERLLGRLHAAEARLRLLMGDHGTIDASNRARVDELTATIDTLRAELAARTAPPAERLRYPDPD